MSNRLYFHVECKCYAPFFERIASFNCLSAARAYATQCKEAHPDTRWEYRVLHKSTVTYDPTFIAGEAILQNKLGDPT